MTDTMEALAKSVNKQFGDGTLLCLGDRPVRRAGVISTRSLGLDIALGIGGLPKGRITEIYGPESSGKTTLCLNVIAEAQQQGGNCVFIDTEHALDVQHAQQLGVAISHLHVSQPDTGEQALGVLDQVVKSGIVAVAVVDSVAALVPKAELDGEMGDAHIGLQARLMSQALRKLTGSIDHSNTVVIFTNQLREKVGVMYGCFHYDARISLADGTTEKIGKIVNQKLPVEVLSYNEETGRIEPHRVVNWFDNGRTEHFLKFVVAHNEGDGRSTFACTPNHRLLTDSGWKEAGEIQSGTHLMSRVTHYLTPLHWEVIYGSHLGDGSFRSGRFNTQIRFLHGKGQQDYCEWKASLFPHLVAWQGDLGTDGIGIDLMPLHELTPFIQKHPRKGVISSSLIDSLTPRSLAIWYMDDGSFDAQRQNRCYISCKSMSSEVLSLLKAKFASYGIAAVVGVRKHLQFGVEATQSFHALIAPYVHPSMDYKLMPQYRGQFVPVEMPLSTRASVVPMPIISISKKPMDGDRSTHRFDIEVEGAHTYLVNNVVVHNSPEVTTGGKALKFYASLRLDIRRREAIKEGTEVVGHKTHVKVVKNKLAPPFREVDYDFLFATGIDRIGELIDIGVELGIVKKGGGGNYTINGEAIRGEKAVREYLATNQEARMQVELEIRAAAFPPLPSPL